MFGEITEEKEVLFLEYTQIPNIFMKDREGSGLA